MVYEFHFTTDLKLLYYENIITLILEICNINMNPVNYINPIVLIGG
jgi:hypothetical protein